MNIHAGGVVAGTRAEIGQRLREMLQQHGRPADDATIERLTDEATRWQGDWFDLSKLEGV